MARYLDENEKALWQKVADTIKPLHHHVIKRNIVDAPNFTGAAADVPSASLPQINIPKKNVKSKASPTPKTSPSSHAPHISFDANPTREDLERALSKPIIKTAPKPTIKHRVNSLYNPEHKGLDGNWDKRIGRGVIIPDVHIDLHGAGLQSAYDRLDGALEQAKAQKLRVILLVTGRQRNYDRASGEGRGGIRAVISDWLSASRHSDNIASVRNAHPRHGGAGALYIILRKT